MPTTDPTTFTVDYVPIIYDRNSATQKARNSHLEGKFKFVIELDLFFCVKCGLGLSVRGAWSHHRDCSLAVVAGTKVYGEQVLKDSLKAHRESLPVPNYKDIVSRVSCKKMPCIDGLMLMEGYYTANICIELGCFFCSTSADQILRHADKAHKCKPATYREDINTYATKVKVHLFDTMRQQAYVVETLQTNVPTEAQGQSNNDALAQVLELYNQVNVPPLHQDARRNSLFENVSHFSKIVPDRHREIAAIFGSSSAGPLIDQKLYASAGTAAHCFFKFIKRAKLDFPKNLRDYLGRCLSKGKDESLPSSFRLAETDPKSYMIAAKMFVRFLFALNGNLQLPPGDNNNDESVFDRVPQTWRSLVRPFKTEVDKLFAVLSALSETADIASAANLDQENSEEAEDLDIAYLDCVFIPVPSEKEKELALALLQVFERIFLRQIPLDQKDDLIPIFLVCLSLETKDGYRRKGSITSFYAGLEYFLRWTSLYSVDRRVKSDANWAQNGNLPCQWLDVHAVPDVRGNNIAYHISDMKQICRRHLPTVFDEKVQMVQHSLGRILQVVGRDTTVSLDNVRIRLQEKQEELASKVHRALAIVGLDFTDFDLSQYSCQMGNVQAGYSFMRNKDLANLYKLGEANLMAIMGTPEETEFLRLCYEIPIAIIGIVHVGVAPPSRSSSYLTLKLQNGGDRHERGIMIIDASMLFAFPYEKRRNMLQHEFVIFKFLPEHLAKIVLNFIAYLRPLQAIALSINLQNNKQEQKAVMTNCQNNFLLRANGYLMSSDDILGMINRFLKTFGNGTDPLQVSHWRHLSEFWIKYLIRPSEAVMDLNRKYSNFAVNLLDEAMSHSPITGDQYGIAAGETLASTMKNSKVSRQQLAVIRDADLLWQQLVGLVEVPNTNASNNMPSIGGLSGQHLHANIKSAAAESIKNVNLHLTHNETIIVSNEHCFQSLPLLDREQEMLELLSDMRERNLYGQGENLFKTRQMGRHFQTMCSSSSSFLFKATTGLGKSSLFQYYAVKNNKVNDIVVVIVPMKALLIEQLETAHSLKIKAALYDEKNSPSLTFQALVSNNIEILFVQMERTKGLGEVITTLSQKWRLGRVFLDECQIALEDDYRKCAPLPDLLKKLRVPKTFLTATLEMKDMQKALTKFATLVGDKLELPLLLTAGTIRENLRICLEEKDLSSYENFLFEKIQELNCNDPTAVTMIFCHTKDGNCSVASVIAFLKRKLNSQEVGTYHGDLTDDERKMVQDSFRVGAYRVLGPWSRFEPGLDRYRSTWAYVR